MSKEIINFLEILLHSMVDHPDELEIVSERQGRGELFIITPKKSDVGQVLGKKGKNLSALRVLVGILSSKYQKTIYLKVDG